MISLSDRSRPSGGRFEVWRESFWRKVIAQSDRPLRHRLIAITFAMVGIIGVADFLTGIQLSMLVFYFLPVCLAVAAVGRGFGVLIAFVSVATWLIGDYAAGAHYANLLIAGWNALIALGTYLVVVWLFAIVLGLHQKMEERVRQRTAALTDEIAERERLEKAVLEVGERERHSIGRDPGAGGGANLRLGREAPAGIGLRCRIHSQYPALRLQRGAPHPGNDRRRRAEARPGPDRSGEQRTPDGHQDVGAQSRPPASAPW